MHYGIPLITNPLMGKLVSISGKIDPDLKARIERALEGTGRNESWFVRTAAERFLPEVEHQGELLRETPPPYHHKKKP